MIQRKDAESADGDIAGHKHEINDTNPKHPLWPPSRVSQLVPKWFVHTGKSNLIEKLPTTQCYAKVLRRQIES